MNMPVYVVLYRMQVKFVCGALSRIMQVRLVFLRFRVMFDSYVFFVVKYYCWKVLIALQVLVVNFYKL